ncbi:MAG: YigZ family protein [Ignavibacteria bacterium]|nr:YigZ family protein [Ignavibacteria bacterium]
MSLPEKIKTIKQNSEFKLKEKGSLFLCICEPVQTEEEALHFLTKIRKQYYDAAHHCYSYKFQNGTFKYSDDGEPNGTAGIRIYNAQNHFEVTNLVTVVVRYFGGTKLGVGPLGKAYYNSALECLANSQIEEMVLFKKIEISYDFSLSKTVHHFVSKFKLIINKNDFVIRPKMVCLVRPSAEQDFTSELIAASKNKIAITQTGEFSYITLDSI